MKRTILLLVFFLMIFSASVAANDFSTDTSTLSIYEVNNIAKTFLKNDGLFNENFELSFGTQLYDIDDSLLGYLLHINSQDGKNGYIIVSATKDRLPVLEFAEHEFGYDYKTELAKGKKTYYLGALNYTFAFDKKDLEKAFYDKIDTEIQMLNKNNQNLSTDQLDLINELSNASLKGLDRGDYTEQWQYLIAPDQFFINSEKNLNVTRIWQHTPGVDNPNSACGPTSGAMVSAYLKSKGYNVDDARSYGGNADFINYLWDEMAWYFGAGMGSYRSTMLDHFNKNYSNNPWSIVTWETTDFTRYKGFIDEGFPVTIRFNNITSKPGVAYKWHFVVGEAYRTTSGVNYVGVKDPDSGEHTTSTVYFGWDVNAPYMSLSRIQYR